MSIENINDTNSVYAGYYDKYGEGDIDKTNNYLKIPISLLYDDPKKEDGFAAFHEDYKFIKQYYHRYYSGIRFETNDHMVKKSIVEDGNVSEKEVQAYAPAKLKIRKIAKLINKQSRFLFGAEPDIKLKLKMDLGDSDEEENTTLSTTKEMIDNILETTSFTSKLFVASKDCAIGKRVAVVINFNEDAGITIDFLPSLNFVYEYDSIEQNKLKYFAYFKPLTQATTQGVQNWFIKKIYKLERVPKQEGVAEQEDDNKDYSFRCHVQEIVYDDKGEDITSQYETTYQVKMLNDYIDLNFIPAEVIINNGLLGDTLGVSDVEDLQEYESWFNAMDDTSIDALRQAMHPMKYTVDMDTATTQFMSNKPGAYADLQSDRNGTDKSPDIGILESNLSFTEPLDNILKMINKEMYDFVDVPDIDLETMSGVITSGKALKALYWGLIIRCDEKMKTWSPSIKRIMNMLLEGCYVYNTIAQRYLGKKQFPSRLEFEFEVTRNNPLPEDEADEKTVALQEVNAQVLSRKAYLKRFYKMNDDQANAELIQIAVEMNMLDNSAIPFEDLENNDLYGMFTGSTGNTNTGTTNNLNGSQVTNSGSNSTGTGTAFQDTVNVENSLENTSLNE